MFQGKSCRYPLCRLPGWLGGPIDTHNWREINVSVPGIWQVRGSSVGWCTALQPRGRGCDSRWDPWYFSLTWFFWALCVHVVGSSSNRNEYQRPFLGGKRGGCAGLTTLTPFCTDYRRIRGALTSWSLLRLSGPVQGQLYLILESNPNRSTWNLNCHCTYVN